MLITEKKVDYLVVDTTAFIQNIPLQDIANNVVTTQDVIDEIKNKRQLRRLVVLPYDLIVKDVFPENVKVITEFAQKTGDYLNLSSTDIKVMALTYQLEKEHVGTDHLRESPIIKSTVNIVPNRQTENVTINLTGFYMPKNDLNEQTSRTTSLCENDTSDNKLLTEIASLKVEDSNIHTNLEINTDTLTNVQDEDDDILTRVQDENDILTKVQDENDILTRVQDENEYVSEDNDESEDDDDGWITPANVHEAKKQLNGDNVEEKFVKVACITTDFAMQNVLKQINLSICTLDGRIINQLRTYILRCYACFKTTSVMTSKFCPKCGNSTLKRVAVSVDENGKQIIHINPRHPLTTRGKKFSLPTVQGGKYSKNPILAPDQPMPDQRPTKLARERNNPLNDDYIAGFSPFITHDVHSRSAQLGIRSGTEVKHWMRKNPNEARRKRK